MKNKKIKFDEKCKKELSEELYRMAESNELALREMLEKSGVDTSKTKIVDRSKFIVKYLPDVIEELFEKYGTSKFLMDDDKIREETLELAQKRLHDDLAKQPVKSWNIYYVLLHCKVSNTINIEEKVKLTYFSAWPCNDYLEVFDKLINSLGPIASSYSEKSLEEFKEQFRILYSEKNPVTLLIFQDVNADSEDEVYAKTRGYAENVILCMSNLINSSIELRGWIIEHKLGELKESSPTIYFSHYNLTYMKPEDLEKAAKRILQEIDKKPLLEFALKYEKEALSDNEEKFRLLKRWSALEFLAEEYFEKFGSNKKLLSNKDLGEITKYIESLIGDKVDFNKNPRIKEKISSSVGQINYKNAKEKVRDLLDYAGYLITKLDKKRDVIDLIYQLRNCITHSGGCYKYDKKIKKECKGNTYCKESKLGLEEINGELSRMLAQVIGAFIGAKFKFESKIPEHIKNG